MTIKSLTGRHCSNRHIARLLGVTEGTVRYHRRRQASGAADGRSGQQPVTARFHGAIDAYVSASGEESPSNVAALHAWLVAEHDYPAGLRSVQRYVRRAYPAPARRARRRVETPPGVQAQANWASFPGVWVGGTRRDPLAFLLTLSCVGMPVEAVRLGQMESPGSHQTTTAYSRRMGLETSVKHPSSSSQSTMY